jgi:protein involved in polysaccharide export with SLBB domain
MRSLTLFSVVFSFALTLMSVGQNQPAKPSGAPKQSAEKAAKPAPLLKAGDSVMIEILEPASEAPNINAIYAIKEDGTLKVPRLQAPVQVADLTMEQLARHLEGAYRKEGVFKDSMFRIGFPKNCGCAHIVTVSGEVKSGGREVPLRDGMSLLQAIRAAGGFTEHSDTRKVKLIRGAKESICNLRHVPNRSHNPVLKDGDRVHVPRD